MRVPIVDLYAQYLTIKQEIDRAIAEVIAESAYIGGRHVNAFEQTWASTLGVKRCISCANGTDAIYIALRGLRIKHGDEVITSAHSSISTSETITQAGGRVVFCDTDAETFTIDPDDIQRKITPATVGIIPVHLYGQAANMDAIMAIARRHNLWVIEDCGQAHLARYKGRYVGTFGDAATFSFYPDKNFGAYGDAGCVVTNDDRLAEWITTFARHGGKGDHIMEGINSRMDGLQAAILNAKLPHLPAWTEARRYIASRYDEHLHDIGDIIIPKVAPDRDHVYHLYVVRTENRDALRDYLTQAGVSTDLNYPKALPFYSAYAHLGYVPSDFPLACFNQSRTLSLPIYPEMTKEMILHTVKCIGNFFQESQEPDSIHVKVIQFAERC
ncbi:MAG: erythromycin biosynthesis sensory transduction protein eryC1 [Verrucomicrobia bacterium]|nr:MAG: erythromycin biosynthesis sensory transduction protein eryC1 [Verrucomicrobiota bacterium]